MGKFNYQKAQQTALRLINQFGQSVKIVRVDNSEYDPIEGQVSNPTIYQTDATVVTLPASQGTVQSSDNKFQDDLKVGKIRFFYVAHKGLLFPPKQGDHLLFEGAVWDIAGTTPLNPAGIPVLYTLGCRIGNIASFESIVSTALSGTPSTGGMTFEGLQESLDELNLMEDRVANLEISDDDDVETKNLNW